MSSSSHSTSSDEEFDGEMLGMYVRVIRQNDICFVELSVHPLTFSAGVDVCVLTFTYEEDEFYCLQ